MLKDEQERLTDICYKYILRDIAYGNVTPTKEYLDMGGSMAGMASTVIFKVISPIGYKHTKEVEKAGPLKMAFAKVMLAKSGCILTKDKKAYKKALNRRADKYIEQVETFSDFRAQTDHSNSLIRLGTHINNYNECEKMAGEGRVGEVYNKFLKTIDADPVTARNENDLITANEDQVFLMKCKPSSAEWKAVQISIINRIVEESLEAIDNPPKVVKKPSNVVSFKR